MNIINNPAKVADTLEFAKRVHLFGVDIHNLTMDETLQAIGEIVERRKFVFAITPNVDHTMKYRKSVQFRELYKKAGLVVADGMPLLWAARLLGTPLKERIAGVELFERCCAFAAERGYSVFLMGGSPGAAESARRELLERHPALKIAGLDCPPYGFAKDAEQNRALQQKIRASGADILFVGLGAPLQELWMSEYGAETGVSFAIGVGVSFSFVGGLIPRAPVWMQRNGLEWLWRLGKEPRRLWKRYLVEALPFFAMLVQAMVKRRLARRVA